MKEAGSDPRVWDSLTMVYIYNLIIFVYILCVYIYHGLIAQSDRASERNSVVVGSNPTQANFL